MENWAAVRKPRNVLEEVQPVLTGDKSCVPGSVSDPDRPLRELLEMLRCPRCAGGFAPSDGQHDPGFDILRCSCSKWPVVAGIPIFSRPHILPAGQRPERIVSLIESHSYKEALLSLLLLPPVVPTLAPSWVQRLPTVIGIRRLQRLLHEQRLQSWRDDVVDVLLDCDHKSSACDLFDVRFRKSRERTPTAYEYFACRFGQPRHLVALSLITLLDHAEDWILDLGCGPGHMMFSLLQRAKSRPVIGIDRDFTMLRIAKEKIAPAGHYICMNADQRLPFGKGSLSGVLCSDAFHYFEEKVTAVDEMLRTVHHKGVIALAVLRNSQLDYKHAGLPLAPEEYSHLFDSVPHRIMRDEDILTSYLQKQGPQLAVNAGSDSLKRSPSLSLVASAQAELLVDSGKFREWPHAAGQLVVNPLYRMNMDSPTGLRLRRDFPSEWYEVDHPELKEYLPEHLELSSGTLHMLASRDHSPEAEALIQSCAILGMPEHYGAGTPIASLLGVSADQETSATVMESVA